MGARFVGVSVRYQTVTWLGWVGLAAGLSCSVFPDEATLPTAMAGTSPGGDASASEGGLSGATGGQPSAGVGTEAGGGAGLPAISQAGAPEGGGGSGGALPCASPTSAVGMVTADTWIEFARPNALHGNDKMLSVIAGGEERRALLQAALPAIPEGAVVLHATLALHLESNADARRAMRRLAVRLLAQEVVETRASWLNWNNAGRTWNMEGGDFGPVLATATVPAGVAEGTVGFDVTVPVEEAVSDGTSTLPFIVLETSAVPPAPAELAFTSKEGNASNIPQLIVDYCEP